MDDEEYDSREEIDFYFNDFDLGFKVTKSTNAHIKKLLGDCFHSFLNGRWCCCSASGSLRWRPNTNDDIFSGQAPIDMFFEPADMQEALECALEGRTEIGGSIHPFDLADMKEIVRGFQAVIDSINQKISAMPITGEDQLRMMKQEASSPPD